MTNFNNILWYIIIGGGILLRVLQLNLGGYANDELSALFRAQFSTFHELITNGVCPDGHPAGMQVYLYFFVKLIGTDEVLVRILPMLCGVASLFLLKEIGQAWFGETTSLLSVAAFAFLEFPLLQTRFARPYSPGLFAVLLMAFCLTKIIFASDKATEKHRIYLIGFVMSAVFCMYIHYFAGLQAIIIGITGLFLVSRQKRIVLFLLGILVALLFLPHLSITLLQLKIGGLAWLGKPNASFLFNYWYQMFNESWILFVFFIFISLIFHLNTKTYSKFHIIALIWATLPFLIGFIKSIYGKPVLQSSVLYFSFPFGLLFIFSGGQKLLQNISLSIVTISVGILLIHTLIIQNYFQKEYYGQFRSLAQNLNNLYKTYGKENMTIIADLNQVWYINFYLKQYGNSLTKQDCFENLHDANYKIENSKNPYFAMFWSSKPLMDEIPELIRNKYAVKVFEKVYYNSGIVLFKEGKRPVLINENCAFENYQQCLFKDNKESIQSNYAYSGKYAVHLNKENIYSPCLVIPIKKIALTPYTILSFSVQAMLLDTNSNATMVIECSNQDSCYFWHGTQLSTYITKTKQWKPAFHIIHLPSNVPPESVIKVYVYTHNATAVVLDNFSLKVVEGTKYNPY